jgi:hypothetical protein
METQTTTIEHAPAAPAAPIDRAHLAQATFNDPRLEREIVQLFDRQAVLLMARIRSSSPSAVAGLAYTLKGSAAGVGAWNVARAAEAAERASSTGAHECNHAVRELTAAVDEARMAIIELLRAPEARLARREE